ncbi:hypothetical protein F442_18964 [Phytophthora nicotianae P10297]|uniref:Uncharacterized protein n=1 Tax=Phytophthora nicotianae P10297 TaxID=1317064 RepID=W2YDQ6_PHYNI|nr:hypothetical protein F442_18964 [Phytophthora nicotianae P10297]
MMEYKVVGGGCSALIYLERETCSAADSERVAEIRSRTGVTYMYHNARRQGVDDASSGDLTRRGYFKRRASLLRPGVQLVYTHTHELGSNVAARVSHHSLQGAT